MDTKEGTESDKRAKEYWSRPEFEVKETGTNLDGSTWVKYPAVGEAWQTDKFINEKVKEDVYERKHKRGSTVQLGYDGVRNET